MFPFIEYPNLTLKVIKPDDGVGIFVEKINWNFDQIIAFKGGPKGDQGDKGDQGIPGATVQGLPGDKGDRGSKIWIVNVNVNDGDLVPPLSLHKEGDILIDSQSDYFEVVKNPITGVLYYSFKFNLANASLSVLIYRQDIYAALSGSTITKYTLYNSDVDILQVPQSSGLNKVDNTVVFAKRTALTLSTDKAEFYRVVLGSNSFPGVQDFTHVITNLIDEYSSPNAGDIEPTGTNFYAQQAFKYRDSITSNVGARSAWHNYKEYGSTRSIFGINNNNQSAIFLEHDFVVPTNDKIIMKSDVIRVIRGIDSVNSYTGYLDLIQSTTNNSIIKAYRELLVTTYSTSTTEKVVVDYPVLLITTTTSAAVRPTINFDKGVLVTVDPTKVLRIESTANELVFNNATLTPYSGTTMTVELEGRLVIFGGAFGGYVDFITAIGFSSQTLTLSAGILSVNTNDGMIVKVDVSGGGNSITGGIANGFLNQTIVLTPLNGGLMISNTTNIILQDDEKLYLNEGEYLWLRLETSITGNVWREIGKSTPHRNRAKYFAYADVLNDFNNLTQAGVYKQIDIGLTCANRSPIGHNDILTEVYVDPLTGNCIQVQTSVLTTNATTAVERWERRRSYVWIPVPGYFAYAWGAWYNTAYTNKNQQWTALQEEQFYPTLLTNSSVVGGKLVLPKTGGNCFYLAFTVPTVISSIETFSEGTEITLVNYNFQDVTIDYAGVSGGGTSVFGLLYPLLPNSRFRVTLQPMRLKRAKAALFLPTQFWHIASDIGLSEALHSVAAGINPAITYFAYAPISTGGPLALTNTWYSTNHTFVGIDPNINNGAGGAPTMTWVAKRNGKYMSIDFTININLNFGPITDFQIQLPLALSPSTINYDTYGQGMVEQASPATNYNRLTTFIKAVAGTNKLLFSVMYDRPDMVTAGGPSVPQIATASIWKGHIDLILSSPVL